MRLRALPVGDNTISFAWAESASGIEYDVEASGDGWTVIVPADAPAGPTPPISRKSRS
jgi:hypothetical protein